MIDWESIKNKYSSQFSHILFDMSRLSKKRNARIDFGIADDEKIIAFISQNLLFYSQESIVFTDKAIYFIKKSSSRENKISWVDACYYVMIQGALSYSCKLVKPDKTINLTESKLAILDAVLKAKQGNEIIRFIRCVQSEIVSNDSTILQKRRGTIEYYFEQARKELKRKLMDDSILKIIESISEEDFFAKEADLLLGENMIKSCDRSKVLEYVKKIESKYSENALKDVYQKLIEKESNFLYDLKNPNYEFDLSYINETNKSAEANAPECIPEIEFYQYYESDFDEIALYIYLRNYPYKSYETLKKHLEENEKGTGKLEELYKFCCVQKNLNMKKAFLYIKEAKQPETILVRGSDGMGMTPLHYAFSYGNQEVIEKLASNSRLNPITFDNVQNEIADVLDLSVVAKFFGYDELSKKLFENSSIMLALKKSRRKYYAMAGLCAIEDVAGTFMSEAAVRLEEKRLNELKENDPDAYRRMVDTEQLGERYYDNDEEYNELLKENTPDSIRRVRALQALYGTMQVDAETKINQYRKEIDNIDAEIERHRQLYKQYLEARVDNIKKSDHPFVCQILEFYRHPEKIESYLTSLYEGYVVYILEGHYFFIDKRLAEAVDKYQKLDDNLETENEHVEEQKIYGESWFSDAAHADAYILTIEYRELAKIYHPDVNPNYGDIFAEINVERAQILEQIK